MIVIIPFINNANHCFSSAEDTNEEQITAENEGIDQTFNLLNVNPLIITLLMFRRNNRFGK